MLVSLIICTRNRHQDLKEILECLVSQKLDNDFDFEVLVIDNNSSDHTKETVNLLMPKFNGRLTYLFEIRQGRPFCMNLGIQHAKGEIVAFTDDDCLVEDDYISAIAKAFMNAGTEIGFMGGKIVPKWHSDEVPSWVKTDYFMIRLAILDYGDSSFIVEKYNPDGSELFYGANQIFRKTLFNEYGNIDEKKIFSQDIEICARLLKNGVKGAYAPSIKVYHKIPEDRLNPFYFYQWHYRRGKYFDIPEDHEFKFHHLFGVPFWMVLNVIKSLILSFKSKSKYERILYRCQMYHYFGQISGIMKAYNSRNTRFLAKDFEASHDGKKIENIEEIGRVC